ncbi:hypothetical protein CYY_002103 [Polysphondylium violaceum]|uniref:Glutaredoxin n=1 Tax=Polysphondylium violaceum TaxID=133409 RepID=A0A8J4Q1X2_9MYCE|nr:hypothetical protein CYY_002103 [Polysphondylium violaceum]
MAQAINTVEEFENTIKTNNYVVVNFWADWSKPSTQMTQVFNTLAEKSANKIKMINVEAEKLHQVSLKYNIKSVPTYIFIAYQKVSNTMVGANPAELAIQVNSFITKPPQESSSSSSTTNNDAHNEEILKQMKANQEQEKKNLNERLEKLINQAPVMLFMKGHPDKPQCGFSNKSVAILRENGFTFDSFDILSDPAVRNGLKEYSNWPTYPQLYINGKLVGGFDIIKDLNEDGELAELKP